jgi:cytochrome c peroxidase
MTRSVLTATALLWLAITAEAAAITPQQQAVLNPYLAAAAAEPGFTAPSAQRGRSLFYSSQTGGKPETPSCVTCHSADLTRPGQTRAGKAIDPMAPSVTPTRYSDAANVEKWFKRNCGDVLGRECTAAEKSDLLVFLLAQ